MTELKTPLLDELEKGPWPSFVKDMKRLIDRKPSVRDLMGQLEQSYKDKVGHWKHGGIVGVMGYGGGIIGRYSDIPEKFPGVEHFHTIRVNQPSGWFYTTKVLRTICDIWEKHGSGLTNFHGSTGDIILLGTTTDELEPCFQALTHAGFDLGGSGSALRTPSACVGPARCEWACYDTLDACNELTHEFQSELHRPSWPYKFKIKFSGCPNDCVASIARADLSIIGTWKGDIQIDQKEVENYIKSGMDVQSDVINNCPTKCMSLKGGELCIDNENCNRCMHCINVMPKALRPGKEKGATLLLGGKAPILKGAQLSSVIIPFMKMESPYQEIKDFLEHLWEWWDENAKFRERVGELIKRVGSKARLIFDDLNNLERVKLYEKGISSNQSYDDFGEFQYVLRDGDIISPKIELKEPLKELSKHFIECIEKNISPITDGKNGLEVVKILKAIELSLSKNGIPVKLENL